MPSPEIPEFLHPVYLIIIAWFGVVVGVGGASLIRLLAHKDRLHQDEDRQSSNEHEIAKKSISDHADDRF